MGRSVPSRGEGRSEGGVYPPGGGGQECTLEGVEGRSGEECTLQGVEGRSVPSRGWRAGVGRSEGGVYPPGGGGQE